MMRWNVATLCWALALSAAAAPPAASVDTARMEQVIASHPSFMGAVLVARGKDVLLSKGYGSANLEWATPNGPTVKYRLGSVTKQFTAAAILLLEERGKLRLTDPVKKHLPDAPSAWDKITLFHLLTHTSGLPSFTDFPGYDATKALPTTPEELVARFREKPLEFQPGEKWKYSNSGYALLGYLLEKVSGQSYADFVQQHLFRPLGMTDSGYDSAPAIIARRAAGYVPGPKGPRGADFVDMTVPFSAGGLYSTTEDLLRWEQGLFGGKLLSAASLKKMTTPFKSDYALGLLVKNENGRQRISHGGGIDGFNTALAWYPADALAVVVLANINGSAPDTLAEQLAAVAHGEKVVLSGERKEIAVPPDVLAVYSGTYQLRPGFDLEVTVEKGQLMAQATGQEKLPLFAESQTRFFFKAVDAQIDFLRDATGRATQLVLHQGGRDTKALRTGDVVAKPVRQEISVAAKVLAEYAGTYQLAPGFDLVVTVEGGQLMTQATGQAKVPVYAESERRFFLKVVDAQLEFFRDETGAVTHLVLHQGGRDMKGPRK